MVSINGTHLVSCSWDHKDNLKLWIKDDLTEVVNFIGHTNSVNEIILVNNGTIMISGSSDGTIKFWDILRGTNTSFKSIEVGNIVESLSMIANDLLVAGLDNGTLVLVNTTRNEPTSLKTSHSGKVTDLDYWPDKKMLASSSYDNNVFILDMTDPYNGTLLNKLNNNTKVLSLKYVQNVLVSGDWNGMIYLWNMNDWSIKVLVGHTEPVFTFLYINDTLYSGSWDRDIRVWNISSGNLLGTIETKFIIYSLVFN